jgi:hypothetical protein
MKGCLRARALLANRFPVRWEKKNESGIAPPRLGVCCDRLEELQIDEVGQIYIFSESLSIMGYPHHGLSTLRATN